MLEKQPWRSFQVVGDEIPCLIIRCWIGVGEYHIQLSDLSRVWEEKLSRNEVVRRATSSACSIDAAEDGQCQILLGKIESALHKHEGTSNFLRRSSHGYDLELDITAPLPASLPTLKWTIQLKQLSVLSIGLDVVTPLLRQAKDLQGQIERLILQIKHKDHVISKVTGELEKTGHDLVQLFPATQKARVKTNRRTSQREQLADRVEGLGDFNRDAWQASLAQEDRTPTMSSETVSELLQQGSREAGRRLDTDRSEWWKNLSCASVDAPAGSDVAQNWTEEARCGKGNISVSDEDHAMEEMQLSEAVSPVGSRASTPSTNDGAGGMESNDQPLNNRESTADSLSTAPPCGKVAAQRVSRIAGSGTKLGKFTGRREEDTSPIEAADHHEFTTQSKLGMFQGAVGDKLVPGVAGAGRSASSSKHARRLGVFHGKRDREDPAVSDVTADAMSKPSTDVGEARESSHPSAVAAHALVGPEAVQVDTLDGEMEESADQKRERLKKALEEKSKAPVKKKQRRF